MEHVVGVDLGGTIVKAGVVSPDGTVRSLVTRPSGERGGRDAWLAAALEAARAAIGEADVSPGAVGLSVPGAIDARRAMMLDMAARLPGAEVDLAEAFAEFGLPVRADNDANAALAAERRWGGHGDPEDVVLITIGTGIGSAVVIGGRPLGGGRPLAGNLAGHLTIERDGATCICGNRGCGETVASATALMTAGRAAGLEVETAADVFAADERGDERARDAIRRFLAGLATIVINAIHAYQPRIVILSGGVMARGDRILPPVMQAVSERAWTVPRGVRVVASGLGPEGPVLGGAAVALAPGHWAV